MSALRVYAIGVHGDTVDHVVASSRLDAADVWRRRTGAGPTHVYQEPLESVVREVHNLATVGDPPRQVWEVLVSARRGWL